MASFSVIGIIDNIKYLPNNNGCLVFISEYKRGYKKTNGEKVDDKYMSWKCYFKQGLVNYINGHFNTGMIVEVKGEIYPFASENGQTIEGYSVNAQTLNMYSLPRVYSHAERKMMKDSQLHSSGTPDLEDYNSPDF